MGRRLAAEHRVARDTFAEADDAIGTRLSQLCFEGPEEELVRTENAQPAILATSIAGYRAAAKEIELRPKDPRWRSAEAPLHMVFHSGASIDDSTALVVR